MLPPELRGLAQKSEVDADVAKELKLEDAKREKALESGIPPELDANFAGGPVIGGVPVENVSLPQTAEEDILN